MSQNPHDLIVASLLLNRSLYSQTTTLRGGSLTKAPNLKTATTATSIVCAILLLILGALVLIGWQLRSEFLISASLYAAMNEKTALCFIFAALGTFTLARERSMLIANIFALLIATVAVVGLIPTLTEKWEIFVSPYFKGSNYQASRMSIYTAASFLLIAVSITTTSLKKIRSFAFALGIFGPLISAVGIAAILCYALGIIPKTGFGLGALAFHTALGIFIAGLGITALEIRSADKDLVRWLPLLSGMSAMVITAVLWQALLSSHMVDGLIARIILFGGMALALLVVSMSFFSLRLYRLNDTLEEKVLARTEALSIANTKLQQFSAIAAHDLRSPLTTIVSYAELLLEEEPIDQTEVKSYATTIVGAGNRSLKFIDSLLLDARSGNVAPKFEALPFRKILDQVLENLHAKILETNAKIYVASNPTVCGDEIQLTQLFQNLIANALKFTPQGKTPVIEISAFETRDLIEFTIKDNGIGIPLNEQAKVFERFGRTNTAEAYEGTGLGLSVCKKIVSAHHGEIWFESTIGEGTTFHCTLRRPA